MGVVDGKKATCVITVKSTAASDNEVTVAGAKQSYPSLKEGEIESSSLEMMILIEKSPLSKTVVVDTVTSVTTSAPFLGPCISTIKIR